MFFLMAEIMLFGILMIFLVKLVLLFCQHCCLTEQLFLFVVILSTQRTFNDLFVALLLCFLAASKPGARIRNLKTVPNNPQLFEDTSISQPNFYGGYPPPGKIEEQISLSF